MPTLAIAAALAAMLALAAPPALAQDAVPKLLAAVAAASTSSAPTVGRGRIEVDGVEGKKTDRVAVALRPAKRGARPDVFVEIEAAKAKVLWPAAARAPMRARGGAAERGAPGDAVGGTGFSAEDFLPFSPDRCAATRIADLGPRRTTLICEPDRSVSRYSLMVWKFDREPAVPVQVLLYEETQSNLVRMLRFDEHSQVGGAWRPKRVVIEDLKLRTKDVLTLEWSLEKDVAAPFDPARFAAATLLAPAAR